MNRTDMSTATLLAKLRDLNHRIKAGELDRQKLKRCKCGPKRKTPTPTPGLTRE